MLKRKGALAISIIIAALGLSGCSVDPDMGSLESELETVPGVEAVSASVAHPGAPWNTDVVVLFFIEDATIQSVAEVSRASAPIFLADDATADRGVSIFVTDADPDGYDPLTHNGTDNFWNMRSVQDMLGVGTGADSMLILSSDDLETLVNEQ